MIRNSRKRIEKELRDLREINTVKRVLDYCSHHRSFEFYAESLRDENAFVGTNCTSYRKFSQGECDGDIKIPMGYATPVDA